MRSTREVYIWQAPKPASEICSNSSVIPSARQCRKVGNSIADHFCAKRAWSHCRTNSRSGGPPAGRIGSFCRNKKNMGWSLIPELNSNLIKISFRKCVASIKYQLIQANTYNLSLIRKNDINNHTALPLTFFAGCIIIPLGIHQAKTVQKNAHQRRCSFVAGLSIFDHIIYNNQDKELTQ